MLIFLPLTWLVLTPPHPPIPSPPNRVQHIVGNLIMQLLLGIPLELVHKGFEVGMVYLAGVLAGEPSTITPVFVIL